MEKPEKVYEGLKCEKCEYWFSKMYLYKHHHLKYHSDLAKFIDLPPISGQTLAQYKIQNEMLFALLHLDSKGVLMRVIEAETQCTMRIANNDDLAVLMEQQNMDDIANLRIVVIFDVYPNNTNGGESMRFDAVWRLEVNDTVTETKPIVQRIGKPGQQKYYRHFKFPPPIKFSAACVASRTTASDTVAPVGQPYFRGAPVSYHPIPNLMQNMLMEYANRL